MRNTWHTQIIMMTKGQAVICGPLYNT